MEKINNWERRQEIGSLPQVLFLLSLFYVQQIVKARNMIFLVLPEIAAAKGLA